jgi:trimeric autotransporter adhesin
MSRIRLRLLLAITLITAGCGYSSHNYMGGAGMPSVTQLSPNATAAGGSAFTLTVGGAGFGSDSLVYWGTSSRTTTYVSASKVTASITETDILNAGMVPVYVHTGGANSNAMTFTIQ